MKISGSNTIILIRFRDMPVYSLFSVKKNPFSAIVLAIKTLFLTISSWILFDIRAFIGYSALFSTESWPSGRRRSPAKGVYGQNLYQGFESLTLRHILKSLNYIQGFLFACFLINNIYHYYLGRSKKLLFVRQSLCCVYAYSKLIQMVCFFCICQ